MRSFFSFPEHAAGSRQSGVGLDEASNSCVVRLKYSRDPGRYPGELQAGHHAYLTRLV